MFVSEVCLWPIRAFEVVRMEWTTADSPVFAPAAYLSIPRDNFGRSGPQGVFSANLVVVPMNQFAILWDWVEDTWAVVRIPGGEMTVSTIAWLGFKTG